jgi:hypothetical protein
MVLACATAFPLTPTERAVAKQLECRIDEILRKAGRGEQEPIVRDSLLHQQRIREYLSERYARAGWLVRLQNDTLSFRPNEKYLLFYEPPALVATIMQSWRY